MDRFKVILNVLDFSTVKNSVLIFFSATVLILFLVYIKIENYFVIFALS